MINNCDTITVQLNDLKIGGEFEILEISIRFRKFSLELGASKTWKHASS